MQMIQWLVLILDIYKFRSNSLGIRFSKFWTNFEIAWVSSICVGGFEYKFSILYFSLFRTFWPFYLLSFTWFWSSPRNFNPRRIVAQFNFASFDMYEKFARLSTYSNAHAKLSKRVFGVWLPWNNRYLGTIPKDFLSSTNWATQIQDWFSVIKNPKIPGNQPSYVFSVVFVRYEVFGLFVAWTVWSIRSVKSLTLSRKFRKQNPDSGNLWERDFRKQNPDTNSKQIL